MTSAGFRATQVLPTIVTCNSYQVSFHASERSARWYEILTLIIAYHTLHVATRLRRVQVELMIAFRPYCVSMRLDTLNLDAALPKQIRRFFVFFLVNRGSVTQARSTRALLFLIPTIRVSHLVLAGKRNLRLSNTPLAISEQVLVPLPPASL
jgi:hypothetical protein